MSDNASSTNTILIVGVLLILVAFGVWWFTSHKTTEVPADTTNGINVDVTLPAGSPNY